MDDLDIDGCVIIYRKPPKIKWKAFVILTEREAIKMQKQLLSKGYTVHKIYIMEGVNVSNFR